jgi:drug/metabolite transporter (DMT)-like permease
MRATDEKIGISKIRQSEFLLLLTAIIWGFAFVAQRMGMDHVGPFTFNAIRFALGSISLLPVLWILKSRKRMEQHPDFTFNKSTLWAGLAAGVALFIASSFQQIGIVYTTAGKAGFITGLYIIFVPIFGIFSGNKTEMKVWAGAILATIGLYYLSVSDNFKISPGDMLVLVSAIFFAFHILVISRFANNISALHLSIIQFAVCSLLSFAVAGFTEIFFLSDISKAAIPIIYGGIFSVGIAYTLQVFGQKHTPPAIASIILSFEAVFAAIGGWLILNELLTGRNIMGCVMMLTGMILAQLPGKINSRRQSIG